VLLSNSVLPRKDCDGTVQAWPDASGGDVSGERLDNVLLPKLAIEARVAGTVALQANAPARGGDGVLAGYAMRRDRPAPPGR
jgi:hypothetical protein